MKEPSRSKIIRADAKLSFTELPSVFYLWTEETKGESKHKYLILLSADRTKAYFFMINSIRYWASDGEVPVTPEELPCLSRPSWIDCRELFSITREELIKRIANNIDSYDRGPVPYDVKQKIIDTVQNSVTLMPWEIEVVLMAMQK